jgi:uncharacterized protein (DUF934 family)
MVASGALDGVERVELHFPKFTDGRAFSQAVLLRRRWLCRRHPRHGRRADRPAGADARSGFSSAVLAEAPGPAVAERQFARYSAFYQGDALQTAPALCPAA